MPVRRILLGLIAVTVGVAIFLDRVNGIEGILPMLRKWWPLLFIVFGLGNLIRFAPRPWGILGPLLVVAAGVVLLLVTFGRLGWDDYPRLWPAALVVGGFVLALAAGGDWPNRRLPYENQIRQFVWLRGKRLTSYATRFWRADVTVVLGAFELDLREAKVQDLAVVNVNVIFGSVDVIVAKEVTVQHRRPFLLDRFGLHAEVPPSTVQARLTISTLAFFGRVTPTRALERRISGDTMPTS